MRIRLSPKFKSLRERIRGWFLQRQEQKLDEPTTWNTFRGKIRRAGVLISRRLPRRLKKIDFRKVDLNRINEYSKIIKWSLIVVAIYFASGITSQIIGLFIRPAPIQLPKKTSTAPPTPIISEDYETILKRNMFNVEGEIPNPFDQGMLDCLSQAKPSTQRLKLLGTIVMNDEKYSVALIEEDGNPLKLAVKKDELFLDRYNALKIERKKLCFQVRSTQELEYIEIPEDNLGLSTGGPTLSSGLTSEGISRVSDNETIVKRSFLDEKMSNLNEILQTAKAVFHNDSISGKKGFLIQTIDPGSLFAQLGFQRGDLLTGVSGIPLDNPGRGLEAFQKLKSANQVALQVTRGGQDMTLNFEVR